MFKVPLDIPLTKVNIVKLECGAKKNFYFLNFDRDPRFLSLDSNLPHIDPRGKSLRKRYFGSLEGAKSGLAEIVRSKAQIEDISVGGWTEPYLKKWLE